MLTQFYKLRKNLPKTFATKFLDPNPETDVEFLDWEKWWDKQLGYHFQDQHRSITSTEHTGNTGLGRRSLAREDLLLNKESHL